MERQDGEIWKFLNHEKPILNLNTGKVNDVNSCKHQKKLRHENLQFFKTKIRKKTPLKSWGLV